MAGPSFWYSIMSRSLNEVKYFILDSILNHITLKGEPSELISPILSFVALSYKSSLAEGCTTKSAFLAGAGIGISANKCSHLTSMQ
jgi:hypothetical protein